jgi:hypothetical protein
MKRAKRVMVALLMAVLIIGSVGGLGSVRTSAAETSGSLAVTSNKSTADANDEVTVTVNLTMGSQYYSALAIKLSYDTNKVTYKSNSAVIKCSNRYTNTKIDTSTTGYVILNISNTGTANDITTGGEMFTATFTVNSIDNNGIKFGTVTGVTVTTSTDQVLKPKDGSVTITCAHGTTEVKEIPSTCSESGSKKTVCTACGHVTNSETLDKLLHTEKESIITDATCTEKGQKQISCSKCNTKIRKEDIPATGHNYGAWTVVKAATVDAEGSEERICSVCGNTENRTIAKLEKPKDGNLTNPTEQQTTENTTQSTEQQTTENTTQSTEQKAENIVTEAPATTEKTTQAAENKTTESAANSVNTGDATPVVLLCIICALAFVGVLLVARRKTN